MSHPMRFGHGVRWECGCEGLMEAENHDRFVIVKSCDEDRYTDNQDVPDWYTRAGMDEKKFEWMDDIGTDIIHDRIRTAFRDANRVRALKQTLKDILN